MNISFMTVLKLFYFICSSFLIYVAADDLGYCADPLCSEPIAAGITLLKYVADKPGKLSFEPNEVVKIFVRNYGVKKDLIGISLNGKRGLVPITFVREKSTKIKNIDLVPATINFLMNQNNGDSQESQLPNKDIQSQISNADINTQFSVQDHQTNPENIINPTENSAPIENPHVNTSPQAESPSSEGYFDSQVGVHAHQQSNPHVTPPPQQSLETSVPPNMQQQSEGFEASNSPPSDSANIHIYQYPFESNMANTGQHHESNVANTNQQHHESNVANTAQKQHESNMANTAQQNHESNVANTNQQHHESNVANTAQKQHESNMANTAQQNHESNVANAAEQHYESNVATTTQQHHESNVANTAQKQHESNMANTAQQHHESNMANTDQQHHESNVANTAEQHPDSNMANTAQQHHELNMANTAEQHHESNVANTAQHHHESNVANTAQQHVASILPSHSNSISNTQNHIHHSMDSEQMNSPQLNSPQHQYDQFSSGNSIDQQHSGSIQSSFPLQSFGYPPESSFPSSSFSGETNGPGGEVFDTLSNYQRTDSALLNAASDIKQSTDSFINRQHLKSISKEPPFNPPNKREIPNEIDLFQDTMKLLKDIGVNTNEYDHDYILGTSSDHPVLYSSSNRFQQNKVQSQVEENHGTVHQVISQTSVSDSLSHTPLLDPSLPSSATQLKADYLTEKTNTVEQQMSDSSEGVPQIDEKHEDDADLDEDDEDDVDETDIEDESEDSDTIGALNSNNQKENTVEIDQKPEKGLEPDEALNEDINTHSVNSVLPSETQNSKAHKSSKQLNAYSKVGGPIVLDMLSSQKEFDREKTSPPPTEFNEPNSIEDNLAENNREATEGSNMLEFNTQPPADIDSKENLAVQTENENITNDELNPEIANSSLTPQNDTPWANEINVTTDIAGEKYVDMENSSFEGSKEMSDNESVVETDNFIENEQQVLDKRINVELSEDGDNFYLFQIRNLKEDQESKNSENVDSSDEMGENITYPEDEYSTIENSLEAIRSFIEEFMTWVPEPFFSIIMDLQNKGISPKVPVFTVLCAVPCILLIIALVYIKESSKEKCLTVQLAYSEKNIFTLSAEKSALEEKLEKTAAEFESTKNMLDEERKIFDSQKTEVGSLKKIIEKGNSEFESNTDEINSLKERQNEYMQLVKDHEKIHLDLMEEKSSVEKKVVDQEEYINKLSDQLEEKDNEITLLQTEVEKFKQSNEDYEENLNQSQTNCNQLLKEAEVWNIKINELNLKLSEESSAREELKNSLELKDAEVKSLTNLVQTFKSFEETDSANEDEHTSNEEKLKCLMDSSNVLIKLQKKEEESKVLSDKLLAEKEKNLEMEVELLESKSEIDKLKVNYNQALQDKTEATTKLEVLTNYFKDKELLLQKQLGAQEAFREKREKAADSAERQIVLIEQENSSYKYQVASMKQEMEETERNLKTQIATQEKKAHENWIAARAAERKLEDMKQEVTQLRQRLTLLEREQENWVNSPRDDIIRPIPKRISGINDESTNGQDMNNSLDPRHIFPLPPMMLPPDRPLPPLPPLPPFHPQMEPPPFRPQPWHHMEASSDFRMTPPDFMRGREGAPRHSAIMDRDMGPLQSSPLGGSEMRDSRNSTPPHSLPDFHDIPPPPPRPPFFPPPGHHPRYPMPPYRREFAPGHKRTDNQSDTSSTGRGTQPSSQENWPHNSRA